MLPDDSHYPADTREPLLELTVGALLRRTARSRPDTVALVDHTDPDHTHHTSGGRRQWTYDELLDAAQSAAAMLAERFGPGERVAIWGTNRAEWEIGQLAAALAGLVLVTVNPSFTAAEVRYALERARVSGVLHQDRIGEVDSLDTLRRATEGLPALDGLIPFERLLDCCGMWPLPDVPAAAPAMIQFTSGTTGSPKGAVLSHRAIVNDAHLFVRRAGLPPDTVWMNPLPLFHVASSVFSVLGSLCLGATHVLFPYSPDVALDLIERERGSMLPSVPTMLLGILEHPGFSLERVRSLRDVVVGATTVPPALIRRIETGLGVRATVLFGQTEVSGVATQTLPGDSVEDKATTVGVPMGHTEVRIVDPESGKVTPPGEPGEIHIRGVSVMAEYFDMPEQTSDAIGPDGWLATGDLGSLDERGYLTVTGRLKDVIIRGGENVFPREIEDLLIEHPVIAAVAVIGLPDVRYGEIVAAAVVPADPRRPPTARELSESLAGQLARLKCPTRWFLCDGLPLTASGKVQKFLLRDGLLHSEARELA